MHIRQVDLVTQVEKSLFFCLLLHCCLILNIMFIISVSMLCILITVPSYLYFICKWNNVQNQNAGVYILMIMIRNNAKIRWRRWKNGWKREIITVLGGGEISFLKKGGGAKISYFGIIYTPAKMYRVACPKFRHPALSSECYEKNKITI